MSIPVCSTEWDCIHKRGRCNPHLKLLSSTSFLSFFSPQWWQWQLLALCQARQKQEKTGFSYFCSGTFKESWVPAQTATLKFDHSLGSVSPPGRWEQVRSVGRQETVIHPLTEGLISWVKVETFQYKFTHKSRFLSLLSSKNILQFLLNLNWHRETHRNQKSQHFKRKPGRSKTP